MVKKRNYDDWSKKELIKEIDALRKQKTYGLVWEKDKTIEKFDYFINWAGDKTKEVFKEANMFPVLKEVKSKDITTDKTDDYNILIEGDNYHSLATLNFTHNKAIDVIYIDPPYNTGNKDFKYNDHYVDKEDGYRHSKWLSFMEKRLKLARNLLKDTGVIFISIDDNEQAQLKILCDEVFGEDNFVALLPRLLKKGGKSSDKIAKNHDYVLIYTKSKKASFNKLLHTDKGFKHSDKYEGERGLFKLNQTLDYDTLGYVNSLDYEIEIDGEKYYPGSYTKEQHLERKKNNPKDGFRWRWSKKLFEFGLKNDFLVVKKYKNKPARIYTKTYQKATISQNERGEYFVEITPRGKPLSTIDLVENSYSNDGAKKELKKVFGKVVFDYPKPTQLIKTLLKISTNEKSTVLDFMAGTGTTGQAVLDLNEEDEGERKYILCTNNENNICSDICYPRLKKWILENKKSNLKYFTTDFVASEPTDANKKKIVDKSTEMLCIKENAFEEVKSGDGFKIFKNFKIHLGIVFDEDCVENFIKEAKKIDGKFHVYSFSLDDGVPAYEYKELKGRVKLCAIPEVILHVYRRVFKE
jgi:adenine-specific DNA-methyltransferase